MKILPGVINFCVGLTICWIAGVAVESTYTERLLHLGIAALNFRVGLRAIDEAIRA